MEETRGFKESGRKFPPWKVKKKRTRPKEISSFDLGERERKHGEERRKEEEEEEEDHRYGNYGYMEFE